MWLSMIKINDSRLHGNTSRSKLNFGQKKREKGMRRQNSHGTLQSPSLIWTSDLASAVKEKPPWKEKQIEKESRSLHPLIFPTTFGCLPRLFVCIFVWVRGLKSDKANGCSGKISKLCRGAEVRGNHSFLKYIFKGHFFCPASWWQLTPSHFPLLA